MLEWLEEWYESQCNGNWEHMFGIKIETLDNPGWDISIDLEDTDVNSAPKEWTLIENYEERWLGFRIKDNKFEGSCDPKNLGTLISVFKKIVDKNEINVSEVLSTLKI